MSDKDGGAAFPAQPPSDAINKTPRQGMSLRDYFAGQALVGFASNSAITGKAKDYVPIAYQCADAMIKEREK